ncbi:MAG: DUF5615 family PIN-like protein [Kiritimatiellaeota bacterium]|nr:DUF5615 family PIN-like protein [Kiritimatiellota bacterium]
MKIVIDMNLPPVWVQVLAQAGHTATYWASVGSPQAKDREILTWARQRQQVVFTHDLDFGAILADYLRPAAGSFVSPTKALSHPARVGILTFR